MSQTVQETSLSAMTTPEPPEKTSGTATVPDTPETDDAEESLAKYAVGTTAFGYYLSTALHLVGYGTAALLFALLGNVLNEDDQLTPIRASLDDTQREAERPKFEVVADLDMGSSNGDSRIERLSNTLQMVDNGFLEAVADEALPSFLKSQEKDPNVEGAGDFLFKLPESGLAVTKGSFTVWTEPEQPRVREPYVIVIEVLLKKGTRVYRVNDLSGLVVGSDKYKQKIPFDPEAPYACFYTDEDQRMRRISGSEQIKVRSNKVQLAVRVPGADRLVKDTIQIRSRRLRERQELELVFGGR